MKKIDKNPVSIKVGGYFNNIITCCFSDINECDLNIDDCSDNADCQDLEGGFTCQCLPGFVGDGKTCGRK